MAGERILIIDDSRLYREVLQAALSKAGYEVTVAADGDEGIEKARECSPDVVVTDMEMPEVSGEEVCRALKSDPATQLTPIIMFTGSEDADMVEQLDAGADDYLPKSHNFRELKAKVRAFLRIKRLQDQIITQNERLKHENEMNEKELAMAREVQLGMTPREGGRRGRMEVAFRYIPTHWVSGDLFDVVENADGSTDFFVSDVSGHGVAAAFVTAMIKTSVLAYSGESKSVSELLNQINGAISNLLGNEMFVTAFFGRLDARGARVEYVNAGHLPPLLIRSGSNKIDHLVSGAFPLGIMDDADFKSAEVGVDPGDRLILYTDGIIEAADESREQFGMSRFEQSILSRLSRSSGLDALVEGVIRDLIKFTGRDTFDDDVNLVACEIVEP